MNISDLWALVSQNLCLLRNDVGRYAILSEPAEGSVTRRPILPARSWARCRCMTVRVSGLALRYFFKVSICHRMARTGSTTTASTLAAMPLRMSAEPTRSPGFSWPNLQLSFVIRTLPSMISKMSSGSLPFSIRRSPIFSVIHDPILRTCSTLRGGRS